MKWSKMLHNMAENSRNKPQKIPQALCKQCGHNHFLVFIWFSSGVFVKRMAPEGEDINADLSLAGFCSKLLEEDVLGHPQSVLAVGVVQRGVIPLGDLPHPHIGHRRLKQQQLATNGFHHQVGSLKGRSHCTVWLQQRRL